MNCFEICLLAVGFVAAVSFTYFALINYKEYHKLKKESAALKRGDRLMGEEKDTGKRGCMYGE